MGFYYSHYQDWTCPGASRGPTTDDDGKPATFNDYFVKKCRPQVEEITTEYDVRHPIALAGLIANNQVVAREAPRDLLVAFGNSAGEMMAEFRGHSDALVKRIADSYAEFRVRSQTYMMQSYAGNFNARALPIRWG